MSLQIMIKPDKILLNVLNLIIESGGQQKNVQIKEQYINKIKKYLRKIYENYEMNFSRNK